MVGFRYVNKHLNDGLITSKRQLNHGALATLLKPSASQERWCGVYPPIQILMALPSLKTPHMYYGVSGGENEAINYRFLTV